MSLLLLLLLLLCGECVAVCRYSCIKKLLSDIENNEEGGMDKFTRSYEKFGIHARPDGSVYCLEWCPGAQALFLRGDFSESSYRPTIGLRKVDAERWSTA